MYYSSSSDCPLIMVKFVFVIFWKICLGLMHLHTLFRTSSHAFVHCVSFRFWFIKFLILVGITVGAFYIPDGTFNTGTAFSFKTYRCSIFLLYQWVKMSHRHKRQSLTRFNVFLQFGTILVQLVPLSSSWCSWFCWWTLLTPGTRVGWKILRTARAGMQVRWCKVLACQSDVALWSYWQTVVIITQMWIITFYILVLSNSTILMQLMLDHSRFHLVPGQGSRDSF